MSIPLRTNVHSLTEIRRAFQIIELNRRTAPLHNLTAVAPPSGTVSGTLIIDSTDDETQGYSVGSFWVSTTPGTWVCVDTTKNHAQWLDLGLSGIIGAALAFTTINCPAGTDPVAESTGDTLNLAAGSSKQTITGDSTTDTVTFDVVPSAINLADLGTKNHSNLTLDDGTNPHATTYTDVGAAAASHEHAAADITSGTLAIARGGANADLSGDPLELIRVNTGGTAYEGSGKYITDFVSVGRPMVFTFDTTTTVSDPGGPGDFRFNHTIAASITTIVFDDVNAEGSKVDAFLSSLKIGGKILVSSISDPTKNYSFDVAADAVDATGYVTVSVSGGVAQTTLFSSTEECQFMFFNGVDITKDTAPALGGDLNVNTHAIVSASNGDVTITPNGTGETVLNKLESRYRTLRVPFFLVDPVVGDILPLYVAGYAGGGAKTGYANIVAVGADIVAGTSVTFNVYIRSMGSIETGTANPLWVSDEVVTAYEEWSSLSAAIDAAAYTTPDEAAVLEVTGVSGSVTHFYGWVEFEIQD